MEYKLSPKYTHDKLHDPSHDDLIDVVEDTWQQYVFGPVQTLLDHPHGDVAAMTLLSSYFEAVWSYISGESSDGKSSEFFVKGFCKVFRADGGGAELAAKAIYKNLRCGVAHAGLPTHKVHYSRDGAKTFYLTYPKNPDGTLDMTVPPRSIVVNPIRMFDGVTHHFTELMKTLRAAEDPTLVEAFDKSVRRLWGVGAEENTIAMTEEEFLGRA